MSNEKPVALELADIFENLAHPTDTRRRAATELRRQHARIQELEGMLEAVGAGGVSTQRVTQAADHIAQDSKMVAAQEPFGYFKAEPFGWTDCAETDEGAIALYEAPQPQADALDAAEPDTTRLNFMLHTNAAVHSVALGWALKFGDCHWQEGTYGTARDAIDAAIAAAKENK